MQAFSRKIPVKSVLSGGLRQDANPEGLRGKNLAEKQTSTGVDWGDFPGWWDLTGFFG
jgi:hypothetical protein